MQVEICCRSEAGEDFVGYTEALSSARFELAEMSRAFPQITSSNSRFSDWIARSVSDLEMMIAGNPEHNYPYAGVPWFSTVFGRDGIITALQTLWLNPSIAKGVLEYLAASQADEIDSVADSEPGKILARNAAERNGEAGRGAVWALLRKRRCHAAFRVCSPARTSIARRIVRS